MALALQTFNHNTPSAPTCALGMLIGASGVSMRDLQALGVVTGTSSADGSFNDISGFGHIDYDTSGNLYVTDSTRIQKFTKDANGLWVWSATRTATQVFGSALAPYLMAIDRTVSPNQIHLACQNEYVDSTWVGVWSVADFASMAAGNRVRSYGSNANSNTAGKSYQAIGLTIDGTYAVVVSSVTPFRLLRWNHTTGSLANEATPSIQYARFTTDGAGNWWSTAQSGAGLGLRSVDVTSFTAGSRIDTAWAQTPSRRKRTGSDLVQGAVYYGSRLYLREFYGRTQTWTSGGTYVDEALWDGGMGTATPHYGHGPGSHNGVTNPTGAKHNVVVDASSVAEYLQWGGNADNAATQSFLLCWPMSAATATWTKTDFSTGTNTIKCLAIQGTNVSGEKFKVRIQKNSGSWVVVTPDLMTDTTTLASVGTFTSGDTLTVELSLSVWDRLDGHAVLASTRDKLNPTNVRLIATYEDSSADVYVPGPSGAIKGRLGAAGSLKGRISKP